MSVNKERDLRYIKAFKKITLSSICKDLNIDMSNIYRGVASAEKIKLVKEEIKLRLEQLEKELD